MCHTPTVLELRGRARRIGVPGSFSNTEANLGYMRPSPKVNKTREKLYGEL